MGEDGRAFDLEVGMSGFGVSIGFWNCYLLSTDNNWYCNGRLLLKRCNSVRELLTI